jgi:hypothetical protein
MARRSKATDALLGVLLIVGAAIAAVVKFFETVGVVIPVIALAVGVAIYIWLQHEKEKTRARELAERRAMLMEKYKDEKIVDGILTKSMWVGQTQEQLVDSIGQPHDIDQKVLKTKKKEVWKYGYKCGNRYGYRITLENEVVVGWDEKM